MSSEADVVEEVGEKASEKIAENQVDEIEKGLKKVILKSSDGVDFEVEVAAVKASVVIKNIINDGCADGFVPLPNVMAVELARLIEYLNHHVGASEKKMSELEGWNKQFVDLDNKALLHLMMAASYLDMQSLLDLTAQAVANTIKDMPINDRRECFGIRRRPSQGRTTSGLLNSITNQELQYY